MKRIYKESRKCGFSTEYILKLFLFSQILFCVVSCSRPDNSVYDYDNIINISYTPEDGERCNGWFSDCGSWYGFTVPDKDNWVNGFCGPFALDMLSRKWLFKSIVEVSFSDEGNNVAYSECSSCHYPGELHLSATSGLGTIMQELCFLDSDNVLIKVKTDSRKPLKFSGQSPVDSIDSEIVDNKIIIMSLTSGNCSSRISLTFPENSIISISEKSYEVLPPDAATYNILIAFDDADPVCYKDVKKLAEATRKRWQGYLNSVLRDSLPKEYNRIAVKSIVTLISNWKKEKGDIKHDGVVPSQGVGYFMGFWGWDSWKQAVALSLFAPELAKDQIRAMFDYQTPEGMIIDCIFTDSSENNSRDSKPPLATWAVFALNKSTGDIEFVREMLPKLYKYHEWWYKYRDNDKNGICEYGSCDGSLEAAAWESGMDNAIRFDETMMLNNNISKEYDQIEAWSMNQESVDLNSFLVMEDELLRTLSDDAGVDYRLDLPSYATYSNNDIYKNKVTDYFFDPESGYFYDRRIGSNEFVLEQGCEAFVPLWSGIATAEQVASVRRVLMDTTKFNIFIPFPTVSVDNHEFSPNGYWRGSTWLDQVYFGITGLRKYGFSDEADIMTDKVFRRLYGLTGDAPIYENYNPLDGLPLEAPNFSWSAAHLLLLYYLYGK